MKRREFVGAVLAGLSVLSSGCLDTAVQGLGVGAVGERCSEEGLRPVSKSYRQDDPRYVEGGANGLYVAASAKTVGHGETIGFAVSNASDHAISIPERDAFAVQHRVQGQWRDVVWTSERRGFGRGTQIGPGETLIWTLQMDQEGLETEEDRHVCNPLETGAYRFVFFTYETPVYVRFGLRDDSAFAEA